MRSAALALLFLALGCADPPPCEDGDSGLIDAAVETCRSRLVLGPVELGGSIGPGDGELCSRAALRTGHDYVFRVRLFRGAEEEVREGRCGATTDYLDLGNVPSGTYDIVVERADGGRVLVGASALMACDPEANPLSYCTPMRVEVGDCDLDVVYTWLFCGKTGCEP